MSGVVIWRANASRHHPQIRSISNIRGTSSVGSAPVAAQTGRLHRQFVRTQPIYLWGNRRSLLGNNKQTSATLGPVEAITGVGIREHYDLGNETDFLFLLPTLTGTATTGNKITSPTLRALPIITVSARIARVGTGTLSASLVLNASGHTETGGNVAGSGFLNHIGALSGAGTLKHLASGQVLLRSIPTLTATTLVHKTATGNMVSSPVLTGNSRVTDIARLTLQPTLRGEGTIRVQSGLWIVIPEDTREWTVQ